MLNSLIIGFGVGIEAGIRSYLLTASTELGAKSMVILITSCKREWEPVLPHNDLGDKSNENGTWLESV